MQKSKIACGSDAYNTQMLYFTCSSLSENDRYLYTISDLTGAPNVMVKDLVTGIETVLTDNTDGYLKSYVYFDGMPYKGFGKASVSLDGHNNRIYYMQGNEIRTVGLDGRIKALATLPENQMTAFTHVSSDGKWLCVPTTDARCLDFDPQTEGTGLDKRPAYDIDERVQQENLNSYLRVYDTQTGEQVLCETVNKVWITHVQFHPTDTSKILYNNEWTSFDCGIRRMWLFDGSGLDASRHVRLRDEARGGHRGDWVCHEMWSPRGDYIIYHGAYEDSRAFVGRVDMRDLTLSEIAVPKEYDGYGHFTCLDENTLVSDGYFRMPGESKPVFDNSTDNGPDPQKKDAAYISTQKCDWASHTMTWAPLCRHNSDWLGQDAHPHPIFSHGGDRIFFTSRNGKTIKVHSVPTE
jgi:oligogalacturonide lyase